MYKFNHLKKLQPDFVRAVETTDDGLLYVEIDGVRSVETSIGNVLVGPFVYLHKSGHISYGGFAYPTDIDTPVGKVTALDVSFYDTGEIETVSLAFVKRLHGITCDTISFHKNGNLKRIVEGYYYADCELMPQSKEFDEDGNLVEKEDKEDFYV